jgi:hypothetical protein
MTVFTSRMIYLRVYRMRLLSYVSDIFNAVTGITAALHSFLH